MNDITLDSENKVNLTTKSGYLEDFSYNDFAASHECIGQGILYSYMNSIPLVL